MGKHPTAGIQGHPRSTRRKMPSVEKQKPREKLPRLPNRLGILIRLCNHLGNEHMDSDGPWSSAAFHVWWWLSDVRDKHAQRYQ
jgi:hypothetical protein